MAFGNLDDPCNPRYDATRTSAVDQGTAARCTSGLCGVSPYHLSVDPGDPTFADANAALGWWRSRGRTARSSTGSRSTRSTDLTPGGAAQSMAAVPYYRDDSCFDDGTGTDPGPKLHLRSGDEPLTLPDGTPRKCWRPEDGRPGGSARYFQGSIATHGLHLLFLADSDNARQTVPLDRDRVDWRAGHAPGRRTAPRASSTAAASRSRSSRRCVEAPGTRASSIRICWMFFHQTT